jgi:hypothetical protein
MALKEWVRLPTDWIQERGLRGFRWAKGEGSDQAAALMALMPIAHHADEDTGAAKLTYQQLEICTGLSRTKIAAGLRVLTGRGLIERSGAQQNHFQLVGYTKAGGWGKLPTKRLYNKSQSIAFFDEIKLRKPAELHALKLYYLFVARRDNDTNLANISYDAIEDYTGIERNAIKPALSLLAANALVHIEHVPSKIYGFANAYRLAHLETHRNMGTTGRQLLSGGLDAA